MAPTVGCPGDRCSGAAGRVWRLRDLDRQWRRCCWRQVGSRPACSRRGRS